MALAVSLTFALSFIRNFYEGITIIFAIGLSASFCFLGPIKLVKLLFPEHKTAGITGAIIAMGELGAILSTLPAAWLTIHIGWRSTLIGLSLLGAILIGLIGLIVTDPIKVRPNISNPSIKTKLSKSLPLILNNNRIWFGGIYNSLLNLPLTLLGAEWAILYLMQAHALPELWASIVVMSLFIGTIIGAPLLGWISDNKIKKETAMLIVSVLSLFFAAILIFSQSLSFSILCLVFLALGILSGGQSIGYAIVTESTSSENSSLAMSITAVLIMLGGTIMQPLFGFILNSFWDGKQYNGTPFYSIINYQYALSILIFGFIACFVISLFLRKINIKGEV